MSETTGLFSNQVWDVVKKILDNKSQLQGASSKLQEIDQDGLLLLMTDEIIALIREPNNPSNLCWAVLLFITYAQKLGWGQTDLEKHLLQKIGIHFDITGGENA